MKKTCRFIAILLAMVLVVDSQLHQVKAANVARVEPLDCVVSAMAGDGLENIRATTFNDTAINVSCSSSGMYVAIHTSMTKEASVVGVKDITVDRLINGTWVTVATSAGGEVYNNVGCVVSFTYTGAVYNATYRVTCVHYADVDGYRELYHEADDIIFVY